MRLLSSPGQAGPGWPGCKCLWEPPAWPLPGRTSWLELLGLGAPGPGLHAWHVAVGTALAPGDPGSLPAGWRIRGPPALCPKDRQEASPRGCLGSSREGQQVTGCVNQDTGAVSPPRPGLWMGGGLPPAVTATWQAPVGLHTALQSRSSAGLGPGWGRQQYPGEHGSATWVSTKRAARPSRGMCTDGGARTAAAPPRGGADEHLLGLGPPQAAALPGWQCPSCYQNGFTLPSISGSSNISLPELCHLEPRGARTLYLTHYPSSTSHRTLAIPGERL
ncbi:uncharacterized protein LOC144316754 [Canis aureus]